MVLKASTDHQLAPNMVLVDTTVDPVPIKRHQPKHRQHVDAATPEAKLKLAFRKAIQSAKTLGWAQYDKVHVKKSAICELLGQSKWNVLKTKEHVLPQKN